MVRWENKMVKQEIFYSLLQINFSSGENARLVEGLVDECRRAKWSRGVIEQCKKIIKRLAKDRSDVNMQ